MALLQSTGRYRVNTSISGESYTSYFSINDVRIQRILQERKNKKLETERIEDIKKFKP